MPLSSSLTLMPIGEIQNDLEKNMAHGQEKMDPDVKRRQQRRRCPTTAHLHLLQK